MNDFEAYDIGAWTVEGLTRHVRVVTQWATRKRSTAKVRIMLAGTVAAIAASAICSTSSIVTTTQMPIVAATDISGHVQTAVGRDLIMGSPLEYWSGLAAEVRSWKPIEGPALPDFPPFI